MTDTDDLTGWRLALAMLAAVALLVAVYVGMRALLWWWTQP